MKVGREGRDPGRKGRDSVLKLSKDVSEVLSERLRDLVLKVSKDVPEKLWLPGELIAGKTVMWLPGESVAGKIAAAGRAHFRKSSNCGAVGLGCRES